MSVSNEELKINEFLDDIKLIVAPANVVGFDFIAVGDDYYYQDYLLHPNVDAYLSALDQYFRDNPSLLLVPGLEEALSPIQKQENIKDKKLLNLEFQAKQIEKSNFTHKSDLNNSAEYYWQEWCSVIKNLYKYCESIYFIRVGFKELVQTMLYLFISIQMLKKFLKKTAIDNT